MSYVPTFAKATMYVSRIVEEEGVARRRELKVDVETTGETVWAFIPGSFTRVELTDQEERQARAALEDAVWCTMEADECDIDEEEDERRAEQAREAMEERR